MADRGSAIGRIDGILRMSAVCGGCAVFCRSCRARSAMPQLQLPIFPDGVTYITNHLAFRRQDGEVTYFNGHMPVFSHAETDVATFRMITSQFCVSGHVKQSDIIRAFGVTSISVKRSVKTYRDKGPKGFYTPRVTRGAAVLVDDVVSDIEGRLAGGAVPAEIAEDLGLKLNTIRKRFGEGRTRAPIKKTDWAMPRYPQAELVLVRRGRRANSLPRSAHNRRHPAPRASARKSIAPPRWDAAQP